MTQNIDTIGGLRPSCIIIDELKGDAPKSIFRRKPQIMKSKKTTLKEALQVVSGIACGLSFALAISCSIILYLIFFK